MTAVLILVLVGLTSAGAYAVGARALGCSSDGLHRALLRVVEGVGFAIAFLALNLLIGFVIVRALSILTDDFVSVYVLEDWTLVILSGLQGFALRWWLDRG